MDLWNQLRQINGCRAQQFYGYGEVLLLPVPGLDSPQQSYWMIGQYKHQTRLATELRHNEEAQAFLGNSGARLGLRGSDLAPIGRERQKRLGITLAGADAAKSFVEQRVNPLTSRVRTEGPASINRHSDREQNVGQFWQTQTPQSHHIVEFNHLRDINVSKEIGMGPMDHGQLPCVLLAAEFHQRYISSILKRAHGWDEARLRRELPKIYSSIYVSGGNPFRPLWEASRIILRAAGIAVT